MDVANLPIRIRELREARGLTQKELAVLAGLALGSVASAEQGTRTPSITTAFQIATALGVTVNDLLDSPESESPKPRRGRPRRPVGG